MRPYSDLHNYQFNMIQWIKQHPKCTLWAEPGLGKTVATLTALKDLRAEGKINRVLVIAPLRVSESVWPQEPGQWEHLSEMTVERLYWPDARENKSYLFDIRHDCHQSDKQNTKVFTYYYEKWLKGKLSSKADVYVINREQLFNLGRAIHKNWGFDTIVLDEASSFKNRSSKRWKVLKHILPKVDRLIELTGTPAPNGLMDIWAQIYLLDNGKRLGKTMTAYKEKYFYPDYNGWNWTLRNGADVEIHDKVQDLCLSMKEEDYLELPAYNPVYTELELPAKVRAQYKELEKEFLLELEGDVSITAVHAAALSSKLLQFCNGAVYIDTDDDWRYPNLSAEKWKQIHTVKLDALEEIIEEAQGEPILVAYQYKHDLARLQKKFSKGRTLDSDKDIEDWNNKKISLMFVHPARAGHGLNLQYGGAIGVWLGLTWDLELYFQFNKRLHRQGQDHPVVMHHLLIKDSIEGVVLKRLDGKKLSQNELMDAMKLEIKERLK